MNRGSISIALALLIVFGNAGCQHTTQANRPAADGERVTTAIAENPSRDQNAEEEVSHTVMVYYFHRTYRCPSCLAIEALSAEALQDGFEKALEGGSLQWLAVNVDEPDGKEFVKDFNLRTSSLVTVDMHNGKQVRWKKLERVWQLKNREAAFIKYVQDEAAAYLAGD